MQKTGTVTRKTELIRSSAGNDTFDFTVSVYILSVYILSFNMYDSITVIHIKDIQLIINNDNNSLYLGYS